MAAYRVEILRRAARQLAALQPDTYDRVRAAIAGLATDPRPAGCAKLSAREGWRIREGSYRVLYQIDDAGRLVVVVDVGHRREIYR